mgnify:CR=1 FL=1
MNNKEFVTVLIFSELTNNYFNKTKILNDLLLKSDTEVVCNYDTDVLLPEKTYTEAYQLIESKQYDVVYPYGCGIYQKAVTYTQETFEKFLNSDLNVHNLDKHARIHNSTIGWCQFLRKENYIKSFMMNENFHAWGPEDSEFYYRLSVLGNRIARINDFVYHLEHSRSNDSWFLLNKRCLFLENKRKLEVPKIERISNMLESTS